MMRSALLAGSDGPAFRRRALLLLLFLALRKPRDDTNSVPLLRLVRANFAKLDPKFAEIPLHAGTSAYTDNKSVITLCLADPATGVSYDINTLMYVALHELAHVISVGIGHGEEFLANFAKLRERAEQLGVYDSSKPIAKTYCGVGD